MVAGLTSGITNTVADKHIAVINRKSGVATHVLQPFHHRGKQVERVLAQRHRGHSTRRQQQQLLVQFKLQGHEVFC